MIINKLGRCPTRLDNVYFANNEQASAAFYFAHANIIVSATYGSRDFGIGLAKFQAQVPFFIFSKRCHGQTYCKVKPGGRGLKFSFINY